ncbi:tetratricopeptide repeat protein [Candidatus Peregrinibacteria bacterium]|nr:tetratricopeptide repeat protein [Candidatus Peregrinibacteria bacterium]
MKKLLIFLTCVALILGLVIAFGELNIGNNFQKFTEKYKNAGAVAENLKTSLTELTTGTTSEKQKIGRTLSYSERIQKGDLLLENGYPTLAVQEYISAQTLEKNKSEPSIKIGKVYLATNNAENAAEYFTNALKIEPDSLEAKIYLGKTLMVKNDMAGAKKIFESLEPDNQTARFYAGILSAFTLDTENAKKYFSEAIALNTTEEISTFSQYFLSALETWEKTEGTEQTYLKALLTKAYNESHEYELAISMATETLKEKNDYRDVWIMLGYACLQKKDTTCALDAFLSALKLDPEKAETQYFLGITSQELKDFSASAKYLESALSNGFSPASEAKKNLAQAYLELGNYSEAVKHYEDLVKENPNGIDDFIRPIRLYIDNLLKPEKALTLAKEAVKNYPENAQSYNLLGWAQLANGNPELAEKNLLKAIELDPNLSSAYLYLGQIAEAKNDFFKAKQYYKKAYDLGKGTAVANTAAERYNALIQQKPAQQ